MERNGVSGDDVAPEDEEEDAIDDGNIITIMKTSNMVRSLWHFSMSNYVMDHVLGGGGGAVKFLRTYKEITTKRGCTEKTYQLFYESNMVSLSQFLDFRCL
jgi:hypothetical protein